MKLSKAMTWHHAVLLDAEQLTRLTNFLEKDVGPVSFELICIDGSKLQAKQLSVVLDYENPGYRRVKAMRVEAASPDRSKRVELNFGSGSFPFTANVEATLRFEDYRQSVAVEEELRKRVQEMRPWHSPFSFIDWIIGLPIMVFAPSLITLAAILIAKLQGYRAQEIKTDGMFSDGEAFLLTIMVMALLMAIGSQINRLSRSIWPKFALSIHRHQKDLHAGRKWQSVIFGTIILGVLINLLSQAIVDVVVR